MERKIIAVDFDGTLFTDNWPGVGTPIQRVIDRVRQEQAHGAAIILWTCRSGAPLVAAVEACKGVGIVPDAVNENLPELIEAWGGEDTRKVVATEYWDDRAVSAGSLNDAGLTPERCAELAQADRDGRLVVLPCKVGDTVYIHKFPTITDPDGTQYHLCDRRKMTVEPTKFSLIMLELKTEFWLTREEAEQALKELNGND